MPSDLRSVLVAGVVARDDEMDAVAKLASEKFDFKDLLASATDSESLVQNIKRYAISISASRLKNQLASVVEQVKAEGEALKKEDATQLRPISKEDVDALREAAASRQVAK